MNDTVKLVIEIPKEDYLNAKGINWANIPPEYVDDYEYQIANGIPLDDVKRTIEEDMSWYMFNEYGNETAVHKELMAILNNIGKEVSE